MLTSKLFWKLFSTYSILSFLTAIGFVMVVSQPQSHALKDQNRLRLENLALILRDSFSEGLPDAGSRELQKRLEHLANETETRLSLINDEGVILGDSASVPDLVEESFDSLEIQRAKSGYTGYSERDSRLTEDRMMFVAVPIKQDSEIVGYARVASPMAGIETASAELRNRLYLAAGLVSCIAVLLTYLIVSRLVQPLLNLTRAAEAISRGEEMPAVQITNKDEIGTLARSFNSMSHQLTDRISELQNKTAELQENSYRLGTVLAGMIEGVIAIDPGERVLFANRAAKPLLDISPDEVIGRPIWEVIRNKTVHNVVQETLSGRQKHAVEFEVPRTGTTLAMLATRMPGEPSPGVVLVTHDVTELRRLENLRHEFVSNVGHELKTPLTVIQTFTETLMDGAMNDPDHAKRFLEQIYEQSERLHTLILDLLSLAKIESGQEVFDVTPIPLNPFLTGCAEQYQTLADSKQITLITEPPGEDIKVQADLEGLRFIVNNLVDNAIKYTPQSGRVTLRWVAENGFAVISVQDTGVGIASNHQQRIFERFYRVDKARSRELGGTGLGLSIVKHLAQVFSGSVSVTSEVGKGSTFTVRLPLV